MLSYALFLYCIIYMPLLYYIYMPLLYYIYMPLLYYIYTLIALVKLEVVASIIV